MNGRIINGYKNHILQYCSLRLGIWKLSGFVDLAIKMIHLLFYHCEGDFYQFLSHIILGLSK
jgi:hypothetical protein